MHRRCQRFPPSLLFRYRLLSFLLSGKSRSYERAARFSSRQSAQAISSKQTDTPGETIDSSPVEKNVHCTIDVKQRYIRDRTLSHPPRLDATQHASSLARRIVSSTDILSCSPSLSLLSPSPLFLPPRPSLTVRSSFFRRRVLSRSPRITTNTRPVNTRAASPANWPIVHVRGSLHVHRRNRITSAPYFFTFFVVLFWFFRFCSVHPCTQLISARTDHAPR